VTATQEFTKGIWRENPVMVQLLGMCPTLAVTTSVINGIGMGVCTMLVLLGSNLVISLFRNLIPPKVRIPVFIVVIASFVTVVGMLTEAYANALHGSLGIFIPLIVVNCIILGRAEAFASRNSIGKSVFDALGMGLGFTLALAAIGAVRELLGSGGLLGYALIGEDGALLQNYKPVIAMVLAPGAFLTLGFLLAGMNKINEWKKA
jgi:Na+-translocating ferredoxin:NAD+ oxidoreductase subunit E